MTEGLKLAAGNALRAILETWTRSPLRGLLAGFLITAAVRSSSAVTVAAIGFVNAGLLSLTQAVWVVFGTNLGTTAHIAFNLLTGVAALALLPGLLVLSRWLPAALGAGDDMPTVLAVFHTLFNLLGVLLMWPITGWLVRRLARLFTSPEEALGRPQHLDATLLPVPELAAQRLEREVARMLALAAACAVGRIRPAPGAAPLPEEQVRAVARLGQEVRGFVAQLSGRQLPEEVAAALPHLLRAVQHAETIAALAGRLGGTEAEPAHRAVPAEWAELRMQALEALTPVMADEAGATVRAEAAYQAVKNALLAGAAHGRTPVAALDAALLQAQAMRRIADAVRKGRRRLRAVRPGAMPEAMGALHAADAEAPLNGELPTDPPRPA
jgi:phosphate:Na+ symporter